MTKAPFEMIYRTGVPPAKHKYPGLKHRVNRTDGMLLERDVAVPMRDGVKLFPRIYQPVRKPADSTV